MKGIILIFSFVFFGYSFGQNYNTALGFKGGYPTWGALNVKHFFGGSSNAIEGSLGLGYRYFWVQGMYERNYAISAAPGLDFYWGLGADIGFWTNGYQYYHPKKDRYYGGVWGGLDAVVGLEYTFEQIPLNLALDFGPTIRLFPYLGGGYNGGFAIRYAFK